MITKTQEEKLKAKGYTVSKSGMNVLKDGKAVGGVRSDGNIWSGSDVVTSILKGKSESKSESKKKTSSRRASVSSSKRPKARQATSTPKQTRKPSKAPPRASQGGPARYKENKASEGGRVRYTSESPSGAEFATSTKPQQASSQSIFNNSKGETILGGLGGTVKKLVNRVSDNQKKADQSVSKLERKYGGALLRAGGEDTSSISWPQFRDMSPDQREALGMPRSGTRRSYNAWKAK